MPKTKRKDVSRIFFSYTEENLKKAIEAVKNGRSKKSASREFNVPRSTLTRKMALLTSPRRKIGPATELSEKEENIIENWLLTMARKGFPVHKQNLILSVKKIIEETGRDTKYLLNKTPGRSWFEGFLKRHPNIRQKYSVILKHDYDGAEMRTMESAGINSWKWPVKEDVLYYFKEDIVLTIEEPQLKNNRGCFDVPELKKFV